MNNTPNVDPMAGYILPHDASFPSMTPHQMGVATPIPDNKVGSLILSGFSKSGDMRAPWAKLVIKSQLMKV